jgi:hypothetical protein
MIGQGKTKIYQYCKQRDGSTRWRIWDNLNPQNIAQIETIMKEVEEELGKRKIGVWEEDDQMRRGRKNGGKFNLKEERFYITGED